MADHSIILKALNLTSSFFQAFSNELIKRVLILPKGCSQVRLVFDFYIKTLKSCIRLHCTSSKQVRYKVTDY